MGHAETDILTKANSAVDEKCTDDKAGDVKAACKQQVRIFFAFYYVYNYNDPNLKQWWREHLQDYAFERSAKTWIEERRAKYRDSESIIYKFILEPVTNESSFKEKWEKVNTESWKPNHAVVEGALFLHASLEFQTESGLELYGNNQANKGEGTLTKSEIESLPRLHWEPSGKLEIRACSSAVSRVTDEAKASKGTDSWTPAQSFANRQEVATQGEGDTSMFSASPSVYDRIDDNLLCMGSVCVTTPDRDVYLGSYNRHWYNIFYGGEAIPSVVFHPEKPNNNAPESPK